MKRYSKLYIFANYLLPSSLSTSFFTKSPNTLSNKITNAQNLFSTDNKIKMNAVSMDSPSAQRNKQPIWEMLSKDVLPTLPPSNKISVLEIACGCGVHTEYFVSKMIEEGKKICWIPTDPDGSSLDAARVRCKESNDLKKEIKESILPPMPLTLDAKGAIEKDTLTPINKIQLMICINMIHISPWDATIGLMKVAQEKLDANGILYCYGPYKVNGTAVESNLRFDESLKSRNSAWGVRNLEDVVQVANDCGLELVKSVEMPANNLSLIFRKK